MLVPNSDHAIVEIGKLRDYCLDPTHEIGKHKARVFASSLGFGQRDADNLRAMLLEAVRTTDCLPGKPNKYGEVYIVEFEAVNQEKRAVVRSIWMIDAGENTPRLVSCYVV